MSNNLKGLGATALTGASKQFRHQGMGCKDTALSFFHDQGTNYFNFKENRYEEVGEGVFPTRFKSLLYSVIVLFKSRIV